MKKIISFLCAALVLCGALIVRPEKAEAATLRNKKIVSFVYDDSGSMWGANWAYANYAMQTFVALLNEEDELYITYMSKPTQPVAVPTGDLVKAVTDIREHADANATPYNSVKTAMKQLEQISDKNANTQYWLVVFTDGGFNDQYNDDVAKDLDRFEKKQMANGTTPQIMYMTIGDTDGTYTPHPSSPDITVIRAEGEEDVRDSMFEIASRVTGRVRVDDKDIKLKDDRTVTLSSNVPLFNISILVQNKDIRVESIKNDDGKDIPIKYEIPVRMPDPTISGADDINDMFGAVTLAGYDQGNIAAGDYTVTFSDKVEKEDIMIMLEPALQLKLKIMVDGVEVTDLDQISSTAQNVSAVAGIYEYGTDNEVLDSLLPSGVSKHISFSIDGKEISSVDGLQLDNLAIAEGDNAIHASLDIAGYFNLDTTLEFTPQPLPNIDRIDAELSYDGSERGVRKDGTRDAENVVYLTHLKTNRTGIRFTVYEDGEPLSHAQAKMLEQKFTESVQANFDNYAVEVQSDGSFLVYPTKKPWYMPLELYYLKYRGEQPVGVLLGGVSANENLEFKFARNWIEIIPIPLPKIGLLYLIWWLLFKKHFPRCRLSAALGQSDGIDGISYPSGKSCSRVDLNWSGCVSNMNIVRFFANLIMLILPFPPKVRLNGYTFTGQWCTVNHDRTLVVRNVRNKQVSSTAMMPTKTSHDSGFCLKNKVYIGNNGAYVKFQIEK